jgi:uncharacterized protein (DUF2141 family)
VLRASSASAFENDKRQRIISNKFVHLLINQHRYLIERNKYSQLPIARILMRDMLRQIFQRGFHGLQAYSLYSVIGRVQCLRMGWADPTIKVVINPAPTDEGQIILALCTQKTFPHEDRCEVRKIVPAKMAKEPIALKAPEAGRYAMLVVNDVNSNNKLDANLIGIPKEPVGFSKNPALRFGPPDLKILHLMFLIRHKNS